ncbi:LacI family DNA-binding transcriptional regulator [Victivallis sp. Marseille-Q1083]|uniref:LacI family DNA-binding transcriptional regulator n=1 Tax=Victivallis sp. Marseille-Q1083 TaxID=2717288 RepID=UPI001588C512|nr:LacI family DNA-binding transcriptional regulator [Victivallis sp. Marseille-Q1083]
MPTKRTRLIDIAEATGVSLMTVSQALNPRPNSVRVSTHTRNKVLAAAKEMGYRPNLFAQRLVSRRTDIIGLVIDTEASHIYKNIMAEVERLTFEAGLRLQVGMVHDRFEAIKQYVDDFLGYGIENVLCFAHSYEFSDQVLPLFDPFDDALFISQPSSDNRYAFVSPDYYHNFLEAMRYLLQLGHRRIIFVKSNYDTIDCRLRAKAYRDAHLELGLLPDETLIYSKPLPFLNALPVVDRLLDELLPQRPDALILGNDEAVIWTMKGLRQRGLRIPEDLSILSMDFGSLSMGITPEITSIDNRHQEIARRAVEVVCHNAKRGEQEGKWLVQENIPGRLVLGNSCLKR